MNEKEIILLCSKQAEISRKVTHMIHSSPEKNIKDISAELSDEKKNFQSLLEFMEKSNIEHPGIFNAIDMQEQFFLVREQMELIKDQEKIIINKKINNKQKEQEISRIQHEKISLSRKIIEDLKQKGHLGNSGKFRYEQHLNIECGIMSAVMILLSSMIDSNCRIS